MAASAVPAVPVVSESSAQPVRGVSRGWPTAAGRRHAAPQPRFGYEILLMRLFSVIQWHHFAYMMISVALLGYGAAGTFVALVRERVAGPVRAGRSSPGAAAFGVLAVASFCWRRRSRSIRWNCRGTARQSLRFLAIYALLFVPFFCAATALCLTFTRFGEACPTGSTASTSSVPVPAVWGSSLRCSWSRRPSALKLIGALGLRAAAVAHWRLADRPRAIVLALLGGAIALAIRAPRPAGCASFHPNTRS